MRYTPVILVFLVSCNITSSHQETIRATVYMDSPADNPYNLFEVVESAKYNKPEINIHYGEFVDENPGLESVIRSDTITVKVIPYESRFGTRRYRMLSIIRPSG